jgi:hypothetical protein
MYTFLWLLQRLIRRTIKFAKIDKNMAIYKYQLDEKSFKVCEFSENISVLNDYKKPNQYHNHIIKLFNLVVNPKTGVIWYKKSILRESTTYTIDKLLIWEPIPYFSQVIKGCTINLADNGFYHTIIEELPRLLESLNCEPKAQVIIGSKEKYVYDILHLLKIKKIIYKPYPVQCEELILSEKTQGGIFSEYDLKLLLNFSFGVQPINIGEILFVKRRNQTKGYYDRGIQYDSIITEIFRGLGAKIIYLEDLALMDQIALIKSVRVLIGFHGAGLANLIWINKSAKIIEITESRLTGHFGHISAICKHEYRRVQASELILYSPMQVLELIS